MKRKLLECTSPQKIKIQKQNSIKDHLSDEEEMKNDKDENTNGIDLRIIAHTNKFLNKK